MPGRNYRANTNRPAVPTLQFGHPAGDLSDDVGKNAFFVAGSTAMECALFPVAIWVTSVFVEASIIVITGVQGDAAVHAEPDDFPEAVQRLAAL